MESKGRSRKGETVEASLIFKIAAVGILVSILCQILKHSGREEQAFLVSLAGLLMVLAAGLAFWFRIFMNCLRVFNSYLYFDQASSESGFRILDSIENINL